MSSSAPDLLPEMVIDSFAGGGGASEGIEMAMRRMERLGLLPEGIEPIVNVAINHDRKALAMHAANHPATRHLPCDIWTADPIAVCGNRPVGLLWASPDCRHFSRAKGGKPVSKSVRSMPNVIVNWAELVQPRIIIIENVEEMQDWGPLRMDLNGDEFPDPASKGTLFRLWVRRFEKLGYKVEIRVTRACDAGAPTIRKRMFVIMRRDGEPIIWPPHSHAAPDSEFVAKGWCKPWRTAAEIIDWDRICPSVLMSKPEAVDFKASTGIKVNRPLAENTERRIAMGIKRYVLETTDPFIVTCNHSGDAFRGQGIDEPFATVTKARDGHGLVMPQLAPFVTYGQHGGLNRTITDPMHTVTASKKDTNAIGVAFLAQHNRGAIARDVHDPFPTIIARGTTQQVVAAHMLSLKGSARRDYGCETPHAAITAGGTHSAVVSLPLLNVYFGSDKKGAQMGAPLRTVSTKDRFSLVDCAASPPPMTPAQEQSARKVAAFLRKYGCWEGGEFVTVMVRGQSMVIVDIGMRMLTPRELARAQGFGDHYKLDAQYFDPEKQVMRPLTETDQRHKIGNSVCPDEAEAKVFANYRPQLRPAVERRVEWLLADGWDNQPMEAAE